MKTFRLLLAFLALCGSVHLFAAEDETSSQSSNPMENLDTVIPHGIRLLEAGKYKEFIEAFMPPESQKKKAQRKSMEEIAKEFGEKKAPRMLTALKAIKGTKPTLEDDGKNKTARFAFPEGAIEGQGPKSIVFVLIEKSWYIGN
jgi:hypothetical protein